ncbi:MAG: hypothetical protein KAU20_02790 [Nanoarchaeota archaeon]|nr:hypothetical protein [Nanoarchaeota archaeon]
MHKKPNKRAMVLTTIVLMTLLGVFLIIFISSIIIGPNALLKKAADAGDWIADKVLGELREKEKLVKPEEGVPDNIKQKYDDLYEKLNKEYSNNECIITYSTIEKTNGFFIKLSKVGNNIFMRLENSKGQVMYPKEIIGLEPCLVAGIQNGEDVASNFWQYYIEKNNAYKNNLKIKTSNNLVISDASLFWGRTGLRKRAYLIDKEDNEDYHIHYHGLLYKPDDKHICFIPTQRGYLPGCKADEDGFRNSCKDEIMKMSLCEVKK